jgi:hypothetical protein
MLNATAYTVSGTYTKLNDGCTANQRIGVDSPKPTKVSVTICSGEAYTWLRTHVSGTYTKLNDGMLNQDWY